MFNEGNIVIGGLYRVTKQPGNFRRGVPNLAGMIGKAKWANYRGVCIVFSDRSGYVIPYVIPFDCLESADLKPKKPFRETPGVGNIICGQYRYRFSNPYDIESISLIGRVGSMCQVERVISDSLCRILFEDKEGALVYLKCLEDIGG